MRPDNASLLALLTALMGPDPKVRDSAIARVQQLPASDIANLCDFAGDNDPALAKAAHRALEARTHYACRPGAPRGDREKVADALARIASEPRPRLVRAHALNLLGIAGDKKRHSRTAEALFGDRELAEDARMCADRLKRG